MVFGGKGPRKLEKPRVSSRIVARAVAAEVTRRKCFSRQNPPPYLGGYHSRTHSRRRREIIETKRISIFLFIPRTGFPGGHPPGSVENPSCPQGRRSPSLRLSGLCRAWAQPRASVRRGRPRKRDCTPSLWCHTNCHRAHVSER